MSFMRKIRSARSQNVRILCALRSSRTQRLWTSFYFVFFYTSLLKKSKIKHLHFCSYFRSSLDSLLRTARTSPKYSCETERVQNTYPGMPEVLRDALTTASVMVEDVAEMLSARAWLRSRRGPSGRPVLSRALLRS